MTSRLGARLLLVASLVAILLATMMPYPHQPVLPVSWCLACGEHGTADAIANVVLFLPLGMAAAALGWPALGAVLGAALLSTVVEVVQVALPGRDPSLGDVICNTAGAALGIYGLALRGRFRGLPPPAWTAAATATGSLAAVLVAGALLRTAAPRGDYYGQWTPRLGHLGTYGGHVVGVTLGGMPLPGHRLANPGAVRRLLDAGAPLEVRAIAGLPPARLAPVFSIFTDEREEVLLLGFDGNDLVYRLRRTSEMLRLDAPDIRERGMVAGISPGSVMALRVWREGSLLCMSAGTREHCGLGWTPGRLWSVVFYETRLGGGGARLLDTLFIGLLLLPTGLALRRNAWVVAALGLSAGALFLAPPWVGLLRATPAETAAATVSLLLPTLIRACRRARTPRPSSGPAASARASSTTHRSIRV
jgi:hypothetical protein